MHRPNRADSAHYVAVRQSKSIGAGATISLVGNIQAENCLGAELTGFSRQQSLF